jgi:transcriptional regulator with XRE-family HTH domain
MTQLQTVIRQLRASLSQSEIARRTGIAQSKISRWEAGKIAAGAEEALKLVDLERRLRKATTKGGAS